VIDAEEREQLRGVARRIATAEAHARVAQALYEVLLEGTRFGPCDLALPRDCEWIRGAMALPIQEATDAALESVSWSMAQALELGPDRLLARLERSHRGSELGRE